jgi:hypothetical protein
MPQDHLPSLSVLCGQCHRQVAIDSRGRRIRHFCRPMRPSDHWFPENDTYRYGLTRRWGDGKTALWVLANPSTADSTLDDPTIVEVCTFTEDLLGLRSIVVVNLYARRSTQPKDLTDMDELVGDADEHIATAFNAADVCVIGWGNCLNAIKHRDAPFHERIQKIRDSLPHDLPVKVLGWNKPVNGAAPNPMHPLRASRLTLRPNRLLDVSML